MRPEMGIAGKIADTIYQHHMLIESSLCSSFRTPKSGCSICARLCPVNAIHISDKGAEITEGCINCGVCYSACPNGVFRIRERDDKKIISEIKGWAKEPFRISCERGDISADLILPCLSRLTEVLLLEPVRRGVKRIEILRPLCHECPNVKASSHLDRIIPRTLYLYEMSGINKDRISVINLGSGELKKEETLIHNSEGGILSRRDLFRSISAKALGIATASLPDMEQKTDDNKEMFREAIHHRPENLKRIILIETLRGFYPVNQLEIPAKDAILANIEVSSECTGCGVCAALCPTGAITQHRTEDVFHIDFKPYMCTNCQICVTTCMHKAITIKDSVSLNLLLEQQDERLFEAKNKTCALCQMDFIGEDSDICPLCINRHKKQMASVEMLFNNGGNCEKNGTRNCV